MRVFLDFLYGYENIQLLFKPLFFLEYILCCQWLIGWLLSLIILIF